MSSNLLTFWGHVEVLRKMLFRIIVVVFAITIVAFFFKTPIFAVIFAPQSADFVTFRLLRQLGEYFSFHFAFSDNSAFHLVSTQLTSQFLIHIKVTLYTALLLTAPYIVYQLYGFISPALYTKEKKYTTYLIFMSFLFFFLGALLSYFVVFPFSFRFLANYQISETVENMFTINSYIDTFLLITLLLGILFELPVLAWILAKIGVLKVSLLKKYRKHALVLILILSAIITPTTDIFTLLLVSVPVFLLYQLSISIVKSVERKQIGMKIVTV
ncbi:MAG: twin-arginine translocase subunit TatC [Bacteroidales bacterium]|jgi:sec-independent protein translocase protein TatC|nr:twin-arginine translocase subunit TatC [Bacteroidales bacterium]